MNSPSAVRKNVLRDRLPACLFAGNGGAEAYSSTPTILPFRMGQRGAVVFYGVALLVACTGVMVAQADDASTVPVVKIFTPESVAQLVSRLSSDSRAVRASAEAELIRGGSPVIEHLPVAAAVNDPAVRESVERIALAIEQAESASALIPRSVQWSNVRSLAEAVERLATETGNPVAVSVDSPIVATQPFPSAPLTFWEAIDWIEEYSPLRYEAGLLKQPTTRSPTLPSSSTGPFRVQLLDRSLRTTTGGASLLRIKVRTTCEPRLHPLFLMAAVDEWGVSRKEITCSPFTPHARLEIPSDRSGTIDVAFDFVLPASSSDHSDWNISGQLELTLAARSTSVTFSDLTAKLPMTRRRGQASLSLLSVKSSDSNCTVRVASAFPEMSGLFESYRAALLAPALELESAPGIRLSPTNVTQIQEDPNGIVIETRFDAAQSTVARLHARVPTAISTQKIPFRFGRVTLTETRSP